MLRSCRRQPRPAAALDPPAGPSRDRRETGGCRRPGRPATATAPGRARGPPRPAVELRRHGHGGSSYHVSTEKVCITTFIWQVTLTHAHAYSHDIDSSRRSSRSPEATADADGSGRRPAAHNPAPRPCTRIAQWCSSPSHCVDPVMLLLIAPATCKCTRAAGRKPIRSTRARARNSTHVW